MVPSNATEKIIRNAKAQAESSLGGGLEQMLNDVQSYAQSAGSGSVSFLISHIPFLGPVLSKGWDLAASKGFNALHQKLLREARTRPDRISHALFLLEGTLAASMRRAFNTLEFYDQRSTKLGLNIEPEVECEDCQEAYRAAYADHLAVKCAEDLEAACEIVAQLLDDLVTETERLKKNAVQRVNNLSSRIDNFRDNHESGNCLGTQPCFNIGHIPTPFTSIGNDML